MTKLTRARAKVLSMTFVGFAQVFLATLVIPVFLGKLDAPRIPVVLFGLLMTIALVWLAMLFGEKGKL